MKRLCLVPAVLILLPPAAARADIWGTDSAVLTELLAVNISRVLQGAEQVNNAIETLKMLREQVDMARSVWDGVEELRELTWEDLKESALDTTRDSFYRAYPGLEDVVEDTRNYRTVFDPTAGEGSFDSQQRVRFFVINAYGRLPGVGGQMAHQLLPEVASRQEIEMALSRARDNLQLTSEEHERILRSLESQTESITPGEAQQTAARAAVFQARQMQMLTETMTEMLRLQALRLGNETRGRTQSINSTLKYYKDLSSFLPGNDPAGGKLDLEGPSRELKLVDPEKEEDMESILDREVRGR